MKRIKFIFFIAIVSFLSFFSCDEQNNILEDNLPAQEDLSITLNYNSLSLFLGESDTLTAIVKSGSDIVNCKVSWSSNNNSIAVVDSNGIVTTLSVGVAKISATYQDVSAACVLKVEQPEENGYEYVDLGLSVNWATYNVGAMKPEDYGNYYAWGETEPKTDYGLSTYKWHNSSSNALTKYNTKNSYGIVDNKITLDAADDVAHVKWGGSWRMPTKAEQEELCKNCTWTWYDSGNSDFNGVAGYKVTSNKRGYTDRFIFLPAAGYHNAENLDYVGFLGYYWSSSLCAGTPSWAWLVNFISDSHGTYFDLSRSNGQSVRPVCPSEAWLSSISSISFVVDNKTLLAGSIALLNVVIKQNDIILNNPPVIWSSDDSSVAVVDEDGVVTAISSGTAHITASIHSLSVQCTITVTDKSESEIEHNYVDLGLSVKWATFNVGALSPEDFGAHYAWGETNPKTEYIWSTYKWCNSLYYTLTKYNTRNDLGTVDNKTTLDATDDVAHVKWGGNWRMPTREEQNELIKECTWTWFSHGNSEFNGVAGYKITSKKNGYTDRSIFLPAAGFIDDSGLNVDVGSEGRYWSSSLNTSYGDINSWGFLMYSKGKQAYHANRSCGLSVRPICP